MKVETVVSQHLFSNVVVYVTIHPSLLQSPSTILRSPSLPFNRLSLNRLSLGWRGTLFDDGSRNFHPTLQEHLKATLHSCG